MPLSAANNFAGLAKWEDAWTAINDAPIADRMAADVLQLRLRCCIGLGRWEIGEYVAELLFAKGGEENRKHAAAFFLERAVAASAENDGDTMRLAAKRALDCWPGIRSAILSDSRFEGEW